MDKLGVTALFFLGGALVSALVFGYLFLTNFDRIIGFFDRKNKR